MPISALPLVLLLQAFDGIPNVVVRQYDVHGATAEEIRRSIDAARPRDPKDGVAVDALTTWGVDYRWPGNERSCRLDRVQLTFRGEVLLPRLKVVPDAVRDRWQAYLDALEKHEATHLRLAYGRMPMIEAAIRASNCAFARQDALWAVAEIDHALEEYDRKTRHGLTEGAVFP